MCFTFTDSCGMCASGITAIASIHPNMKSVCVRVCVCVCVVCFISSCVFSVESSF